MPSPKNLREALLTTIGSGEIVRLARVSRPGQHVDGFVVAVGRRWVLIARVMDGGFFDGHVAVRLREIGKVRPDRSFQSTFARTQPEWPPAPPAGIDALDLDTTAGVLTSLLKPGVIFGIEQDRKYDAIWIGVPHQLTKRWLYMWEARPNASWHDEPRGYRLKRITLVVLGDHYQTGLSAIADPPPEGASDESWAIR